MPKMKIAFPAAFAAPDTPSFATLRSVAAAAALAFAAMPLAALEVCSPVESVAGEMPSLLPRGVKRTPVWHDEFNGGELDSTKWSYRTNFWGRRFAAFTGPEQHAVEVRDGKVHLKLIRLENGEYASPQLQTGEVMWDAPLLNPTNSFWFLAPRKPPKFEHRYGYYECRARLQQEEGWWSAFWMQTVTQGASLDPERSGIEHDIMESFEPGVILPACFHMNGGGEDYVGFHSPRYSGEGTFNEQTEAASMKLDKTVYHVFGLLWEPDGYTPFVDGVQRGEKVGRGRNHNGKDEAVSQVPEFLLISTEPKWYRKNRMTGEGVPELKNAFEKGDEFIVDYVRVYDLESAAEKLSFAPIASDDVLEPSVRNEVDHALSRADAALRSTVEESTGAADAAGEELAALIGPGDHSSTEIALKLISAQNPDGRWIVGTNDMTRAAVRVLENL